MAVTLCRIFSQQFSVKTGSFPQIISQTWWTSQHGKKTHARGKADVVLPKKSFGSFGYYVKENFAEVKTLNPNLSSTDIVRLIAKKWRECPEELKSIYQQKATKARAIYSERTEEILKNLTADQIETLKEKKVSRTIWKEAEILQGKPKHPGTVLALVCQEFKEPVGACVKRWKDMSDAEKLPYLEKLRQRYDAYLNELSIWEEKMIKEKKYHFIRKHILLEKGLPVLNELLDE